MPHVVWSLFIAFADAYEYVATVDTTSLWFFKKDEHVQVWAGFLLLVLLPVLVQSMRVFLTLFIRHRGRTYAFVVPKHPERFS